ncbi:MAG: hypothetical protein GX639_05465 [Fibrobacter sp.]|nr:hypothetical protein [Fibrobacter sp.]
MEYLLEEMEPLRMLMKKTFLSNGKFIVILLIMTLSIVKCTEEVKTNNDEVKIDLKSVIHIGMDWKSFIIVSKLTSWEPTSLASIALDVDTIKTRLDTIITKINSYYYIYYHSLSQDTEWLIVNFRNVNDIDLLKKYSFTKERITYNNMYDLLKMNPEKDSEKHNKITDK